MSKILLYGITQHPRKFVLPLLGLHISQLALIGHKSQLGQHAWHICSIQHLQQLTLNLAHRTTTLTVIRLHYSSHHLAILAISELQILNIGSHHCRRILIRHINQLILTVVVQRIFIIASFLLTLTHYQRLGTLD